jgi:sulfoxide reductase heme-binding subunit YedZ
VNRFIKPALFFVCLIPLGIMIYDGVLDQLSANPVEDITHRTGDWALRFLVITLAITPVRQLFGWSSILRLRRMFGLYSFFYGCLHFAVYMLDQGFALEEILPDIARRPYITVGFSALLCMSFLAVTSNRFSMIRLGVRWKKLHSLIYIIAVAAILHFLWLVKADVLEPVIYGIIVVVLLSWRAYWCRWRAET